MPLFTPKQLDDRGTRVRLVRASDFVDPANSNRWIDADAGDAAGRLIGAWHEFSRRRRRILGPIIAVVSGLLMLTLLFTLRTSPFFRQYLPFIFPLIAFVVLLLVQAISRPWQRKTVAQVAATILARRRCGCCGYGLAGVRVGADGLVGCPECDAHWKAERLCAGQLNPGDVVPPPPQAPDGVRVPQPHMRMLVRYRLWTPYSADASGRIVPLVDYRLRGAESRAKSPDHGARLTAARRDLRPAWFIIALVYLLVLVMVGVLSLQLWVLSAPLRSILAADPTTVGWDRISCVILPTLGCVFMLLAMGLVLTRLVTRPGAPRGKKIVRVMLKHAVCPSCAGDLKDVPVSDGKQLCAVCGSVWT